MDQIQIAQEIGGGLSIFCATCVHYWSGKDRGTGCGMDCGSPLVGMSFPHYHGAGPWTIQDFGRFCFMCGGEPAPDGGVRVAGHDRVFGVCRHHRAHLKDYQAPGAAPRSLLLSRAGAFVPLEMVTLRRRTLMEEISLNESRDSG